MRCPSRGWVLRLRPCQRKLGRQTDRLRHAAGRPARPFFLGVARRKEICPHAPHFVWFAAPRGGAFSLGAARRKNACPSHYSLRVVRCPLRELAWHGLARRCGVQPLRFPPHPGLPVHTAASMGSRRRGSPIYSSSSERSIHAVCSCTVRRWVSRSAVGSSWASSASGNRLRAVRATAS